MKICFLMPSHWSAGLGGAEVQVRYIMDYLRRHTDHELVMICRKSTRHEENGSRIHQAEPSLPLLGRYFKGAEYLSVRRLLEAVHPDVVYTRRGTPLVGYAAQYCRRHKKSLVFHVAHIDDVSLPNNLSLRTIPSRLERPLYLYGLRRADVIVAQTEHQAKVLFDSYGISSTAVISNFHPVPEIIEKPPQPWTVAWIANLKPAKRPEVFVELARTLASNPDFRFVMIGAIQDPGYTTLIAEASTLPNFLYLGQLPIEEVNRYLDQSHLFVNTSRADGEGFPNTFIQAWLRGVPVVSLDVDPDGMLERSGMGVFCRGSLSALADSVRTLHQDSAKYNLVSSTARRIAIQAYGESNCEKLTRLIEASNEQ